MGSQLGLAMPARNQCPFGQHFVFSDILDLSSFFTKGLHCSRCFFFIIPFFNFSSVHQTLPFLTTTRPKLCICKFVDLLLCGRIITASFFISLRHACMQVG